MVLERPLVAQLARPIIDVTTDARGLAVLFDDGAIDRVDSDAIVTERIATIECEPRGELLALAGDRWLVRPERGVLQLVRPSDTGPTIERLVELGEHESFTSVVADGDGFFAWSKRGLIFERGGRRHVVATTERWIDHALVAPLGALAWSWQGWFVITPTGDVVAQGEERFLGRAARVGDVALAATEDGLVAIDLASGARRATSASHGEITKVCAVGGHFVCAREDELVRLDESFAVVERHRLPWAPKLLDGCGAHVVAAIDGDARVGRLDALEEIAIEGPLDEVVAFGDSIALRDWGADLNIWSPRGIVVLRHDAPLQRVRAVGDGLATLESDVLRIHRPGVDHGAPKIVAVDGPPMGETIVVEGRLGRRVSEGLVAYSLELPNGTRVRVSRDAPYRSPVDSEEAMLVLEILARRDLARAPLDESLLALDPRSQTAQVALAACLPRRSVGLYLRGIFASELSEREDDTSSSDRASKLRQLAELGYDRFVDELACALRRPATGLVAALRAGCVAFEGAIDLPGFVYLGTFECAGRLVVCDPCHRKKAGLRAEIDDAAKGTWHVWVREGKGKAAGRIAELVVSHGDGLAHAAQQHIQKSLGVDAGVLGIYDRDCAMPNLDARFESGSFAGRGAHSSSGWGDGGYVAYVARVDRRVVKVRVPFLEDGGVDRSVLLPAASARAYSPRERFAKDELVAHPKFGVGRVIAMGPDRVEIAFADEPRTLVHGRG